MANMPAMAHTCGTLAHTHTHTHIHTHTHTQTDRHTHIADGSDDGTSPPREGWVGKTHNSHAAMKVARVSHHPPQP